MAEFVAVFQVSRHGPFLARNLVGKSAGEITARLLDSGVAVAQVSERRLLHPLAQGKISIKDIVYFMEQLENTLFLGMEPRIALKACAITISQKSKSGRNLQRVVAAMERMVAGGESIANVARQFPNLSIQQCCCGPARGGRTIGQHEPKLAIDPRSYRTDRKCSAPDQHDAVTAGDHSADGDGHSWGDGHLHRSAVSIDPGLPRRKAAVADTAHDLDQRRGERSSNPLRDSIGSVYVRFRAIARVRNKAFLDASVRSRNPRGWPVFACSDTNKFYCCIRAA